MNMVSTKWEQMYRRPVAGRQNAGSQDNILRYWVLSWVIKYEEVST